MEAAVDPPAVGRRARPLAEAAGAEAPEADGFFEGGSADEAEEEDDEDCRRRFLRTWSDARVALVGCPVWRRRSSYSRAAEVRDSCISALSLLTSSNSCRCLSKRAVRLALSCWYELYSSAISSDWALTSSSLSASFLRCSSFSERLRSRRDSYAKNSS